MSRITIPQPTRAEQQREIARMLGVDPQELAHRVMVGNARATADRSPYVSFSTSELRERSRSMHQVNSDDADGLLQRLTDIVASAMNSRQRDDRLSLEAGVRDIIATARQLFAQLQA